MPKIEDIIKLIDAGYSRAEIEALAGSTEVNTDNTEVLPAEPEVKAEAPAPAEQPDNSDKLKELSAEIQELRKQLQKRNIMQTYSESAPQPKSAEILASLINPPGKEKV